MTTTSSSSIPRFSLQTEPKSHASTYYTMNNALRKDAIKLDDREQMAFTKSKNRLGSGRNSQFSVTKKNLQLDSNYKAYCSSYSRRGRMLS